jgi:hypothetical protein
MRSGTPPPPGNADEFENKGVAKEGICKLMKRQDLKIDKSAMAHGGEDAEVSRGYPGYPHPRYFCEKRLEAIENKGRRLEKERQEISRVRKLLEHRGLEVKGTGGSAKFVRDNTRKGNIDLDVCQ